MFNHVKSVLWKCCQVSLLTTALEIAVFGQVSNFYVGTEQYLSKYAPGDNVGELVTSDVTLDIADIAVDASGNVYVADVASETITLFAPGDDVGVVLASYDTSPYIDSRLIAVDVSIVPEPPDVSAADYNDDGIVDAADYTLWRDTMGEQVTPSSGADGDGDGFIGLHDYGVWKTNFGWSVEGESGADAIPEPSCLLLVLMAWPSLLARRYR